MTRFESENGGNLLVAALCLLEVSQRGLLETELLEVLADEDSLMPDENSKDSSTEKGMEYNITMKPILRDHRFLVKCSIITPQVDGHLLSETTVFYQQ